MGFHWSTFVSLFFFCQSRAENANEAKGNDLPRNGAAALHSFPPWKCYRSDDGACPLFRRWQAVPKLEVWRWWRPTVFCFFWLCRGRNFMLKRGTPPPKKKKCFHSVTKVTRVIERRFLLVGPFPCSERIRGKFETWLMVFLFSALWFAVLQCIGLWLASDWFQHCWIRFSVSLWFRCQCHRSVIDVGMGTDGIRGRIGADVLQATKKKERKETFTWVGCRNAALIIRINKSKQ